MTDKQIINKQNNIRKRITLNGKSMEGLSKEVIKCLPVKIWSVDQHLHYLEASVKSRILGHIPDLLNQSLPLNKVSRYEVIHKYKKKHYCKAKEKKSRWGYNLFQSDICSHAKAL